MVGIPASFGYWVRRRRIALDLTRDALARRVGCSPSTIKKVERDERRPSRTMALRLADALGLPPEQHDRFIRTAVGDHPPARLADTEDDFGRAPAWLARPDAPGGGPVVGRETELGWLRSHLTSALGGDARVVFVIGEAGVGKTALLRAFADQAAHEVPELVVARGAGTAVGTLCDPYFPFRDVFRMLVADGQAPLQADQLTQQQAQRLWDFSPTAAQEIVDSGPRLPGVLVPVETISERVGMAVASSTPADAFRSDLADDVTRVLHRLAERRPMLIMLDDMQWSDTASAELLFHLMRTLAGARVLVVCAYRGSEVADAAGGAHGVLRTVTRESGRDVGDVVLDLSAIDAAAERALCEALLEKEVPGLADQVRDEIFLRTHGHPLLVLELVRDLKARGDLVRSGTTSWAARPGVNWDHVPGRVAAVIEQRLDRLDADERALLIAAAVEGEYFTAEVAARVAGIDVWTAHRVLAERLDRLHGLVREDSVVHSRGGPLTRYRFGHALFQGFVRDQLGAGARAHAHGLVAATLEELYSQGRESVIPVLAHHYAEAGDVDNAVPYLIQTGDRARLLHASDEALSSYHRAVGLLRQRGDTERLARSLMRIGLTHETAFDHQSAQAAYDEAFALWRATGGSAAADAAGTATLRIVSEEPGTLDPLLAAGMPPILYVMFSGLVQYDEGLNIVPDVAERWDISGDGRRYTFRLRDDVTWTDGQPVTAHDFVASYLRALDPDLNAQLAPLLLSPVAGAQQVRDGSARPEHAGIRAVDDRTLAIELAEPTSYFMYNLALSVLPPVPAHLLKAHGRDWCRPDTFVSNGPFQLVDWRPGVELTLERNPRYHGPVTGNVARLVVKLTTPWDDSHEQLYLADEIDVLAMSLGSGIDVIDRLRRRFPAEYVSRTHNVRTFFYWIDHMSPPLDDRRVRQAMALAIDRESLAAAWHLSTPADGGFVPPGIPGHVTRAAPHDRDRAARLIADHATGTAPITVIGPRFLEAVVEGLAGDWRAVGLPVETRIAASFPDQERLWRNMSGPKVGVSGWVADYPDPDSYLRVAIEQALPTWHHSRYESVLAKAARTHDVAGRLSLYRVAEEILAEEAVVVPLLYQAEHLMLKPWVRKLPGVPYLYQGLKDVVIGPPVGTQGREVFSQTEM